MLTFQSNLLIFFNQHTDYNYYFNLMLLPKLPSNQKQRLNLSEQRKSCFKLDNNFSRQINEKQDKQNTLLYFNKSHQPKQKSIRSSSVQSKKSTNLARGSLISKKLQLTQKTDAIVLKLKKDENNSVLKPVSRLTLRTSKILSQDDNSVNSSSQGSSQSLKETNKMKLDQIIEYQNSKKNNNYYQKFTKFHLTNSDQIRSQNRNQTFAKKQQQQQASFVECQNNQVIDSKFNTSLKQFKKASMPRRSRKYSRIMNDKYLSLDFSVFSLTITSQKVKNKKDSTQKRRQIIEQLSKDPDLQWKYQKFKQYVQKYTECQIKIKEKTQILQFLTQNLQLIKQRITPFKSFDSLTQIVDLLKPTMTSKEQRAYEIKMQMLEWKKKFFTNALRIKQKFTKSVDKKQQIIFQRLEANQNIVFETSLLLDELQKKETEVFQNYNLCKLEDLLSKIVMNQKQMIDQIKINERETEFLFQKFNLIEEQWSHTFDIFNSTLQNCINKCSVLADLIQKFYGKCSNAMFLTKGLNIQNPKDIKMIQNDKCYVCRWNQIKIKKIIEQNSLAKDHLFALKHLIAN